MGSADADADADTVPIVFAPIGRGTSITGLLGSTIQDMVDGENSNVVLDLFREYWTSARHSATQKARYGACEPSDGESYTIVCSDQHCHYKKVEMCRVKVGVCGCKKLLFLKVRLPDVPFTFGQKPVRFRAEVLTPPDHAYRTFSQDTCSQSQYC